MKVSESVLFDALRSAAQTIRDWHGMRIPPDLEEMVWRIYWNQSPEMKPVREALGADPTNYPHPTGPTWYTGPDDIERQP